MIAIFTDRNCVKLKPELGILEKGFQLSELTRLLAKLEAEFARTNRCKIELADLIEIVS